MPGGALCKLPCHTTQGLPHCSLLAQKKPRRAWAHTNTLQRNTPACLQQRLSICNSSNRKTKAMTLDHQHSAASPSAPLCSFCAGSSAEPDYITAMSFQVEIQSMFPLSLRPSQKQPCYRILLHCEKRHIQFGCIHWSPVIEIH